MKRPTLIPILAASSILVALASCRSTPTYQNATSENAASFAPYRAREETSRSVSAAVIDQIDGKAVTYDYRNPVLIDPGAHDVTFRFEVPEAPREVFFHRTSITFKPGERYRLRARYRDLSTPSPIVEFSLLEGDTVVYTGTSDYPPTFDVPDRPREFVAHPRE